MEDAVLGAATMSEMHFLPFSLVVSVKKSAFLYWVDPIYLFRKGNCGVQENHKYVTEAVSPSKNGDEILSI